MVLYTSKDDGQKHSDAHGDSAECTEVAHLAQRSRKADKEADNGSYHAPNHGTGSSAIGQGVEKLGSDETVKAWKR